ncbi:PP2C family protein-serine/threonine phosphatase [Nocardioides conyzicola]|uniref:PP2C family protein-serine/threonine phosphatase n=1 Tax=Nocardioides conyzicola TaxID=1651781 RepID=A0ABP8WU88_9ACTN
MLAALSFISVSWDIQLTTAMVAAPIVASFMTRADRTGLVALVAVAISALGGTWLGVPYTFDYWFRVSICATLAGLAVLSALLRDRREARLQRMTVIAETAQRAVLRSMPSAIGALGLAARYVSASAEALVGGDLYEVAATPYGVRVIVGDVRGKGLEAVQTAATVLGAFRAAAFSEPDPVALAKRIDETLSRMLGAEEFVTAIVGEFQEDRVTLANCGHHPPIMVDGGGASEMDTGEPTVPLGMGSEPVLSEHAWPAGARMLFFTDGLVEARDRSGEFFPLDDFADELGEGTVEEALDALVAHLLAYAGQEMNDDMALVLAESAPQ